MHFYLESSVCDHVAEKRERLQREYAGAFRCLGFTLAVGAMFNPPRR